MPVTVKIPAFNFSAGLQIVRIRPGIYCVVNNRWVTIVFTVPTIYRKVSLVVCLPMDLTRARVKGVIIIMNGTSD